MNKMPQAAWQIRRISSTIESPAGCMAIGCWASHQTKASHSKQTAAKTPSNTQPSRRRWGLAFILKLMPGRWPMLSQRQNFRTIFGHQNRMLELSRWLAVVSPNRPPVAAVANRSSRAAIDHGLDRKTHARIQAILVGLPTWHMRNVRSLMELGSDSVPHVFVDHAKPILFVSVIHDLSLIHI